MLGRREKEETIMKRLIVVSLLVGLVIATAFAVDFPELDYQVYVGASMSQYKAEGFKDTTLWGNEVTLSESNGSKMPIGFTVGARAALVDHFYIITEVDANFASGKSFIVDAGVGASYYFLDNSFHIGIGAKAGYFSLVNHIATINFNYYGYDKNGNYFSGDKGDSITYDVMGLSIAPFLDMYFDVNNMLSIGASVGYRIGFSFKDAVMVASKYDIGTFNDQEPKVSPNGVIASVYGLYKI